MCVGDVHMRSTIQLPEDLIAEAKRLTGLRTKRAVITQALEELVRRAKRERFAASLGSIDFDLTADDLERMRAED